MIGDLLESSVKYQIFCNTCRTISTRSSREEQTKISFRVIERPGVSRLDLP